MRTHTAGTGTLIQTHAFTSEGTHAPRSKTPRTTTPRTRWLLASPTQLELSSGGPSFHELYAQSPRVGIDSSRVAPTGVVALKQTAAAAVAAADRTNVRGGIVLAQLVKAATFRPERAGWGACGGSLRAVARGVRRV